MSKVSSGLVRRTAAAAAVVVVAAAAAAADLVTHLLYTKCTCKKSSRQQFYVCTNERLLGKGTEQKDVCESMATHMNVFHSRRVCFLQLIVHCVLVVWHCNMSMDNESILADCVLSKH